MRKVSQRHSETSSIDKVQCVCVCVTQKGVDESLTSRFIRVRDELPSRIFFLTYLRVNGQTDGWKKNRGKGEEPPLDFLCRGFFVHYLSGQLVCLAGDNHLSSGCDPTVTAWSTTSTQAMTSGNDAAHMMNVVATSGDGCFFQPCSYSSSNVDSYIVGGGFGDGAHSKSAFSG